jgi:hypothetical protein
MVEIHYEGNQAAIKEGPVNKSNLKCQWCGAPATGERIIVKERKSEGVVVKPGIEAPVCAEHSAMVDRNEEVASLWRRRRAHGKNWNCPDDPEKQAKARAQVKEIEARLLELGERLDRPHAEAA